MKNFDAEFCVRYVEAKRNEEEPSFLDKKELEYLEHLVEKVFLNFVREKRGINSYIAFHLADYINFFKERRIEISAAILRQFCFWLGVFSRDASFSCLEKTALCEMKRQCERFLQKTTANLPDEGLADNLEEYFDSMKLVRDIAKKRSLENRKRFASHQEHGEEFGRLYDAWCAAYREGMNTLGFSENVEALHALMNATLADENHDEFVITGEHRGNVHRNSEMQRGVTRANGLKSSDPVYSGNENTLFQSHPSTSAMSLNYYGDFYNPHKLIKGGDLGHVAFAKKNMFVINKDGDIFYSNPNLAGLCLNELSSCVPWFGQVYLGNIEEFLK